MPYQFVVENPVVPISYDAIIWPKSILPPHATESKRVRGVREKEVVSVSAGCLQIQGFVTDVDVIAQVAPTDYHQNNDSLFRLARLVKSYETCDRPSSQLRRNWSVCLTVGLSLPAILAT